MQFRQITQFHEKPEVITLWLSIFGPALNWLTPLRRRAILAAGALLVCYLHVRRDVLTANLPITRSQLVLTLVFLVVLGLSYLVFLAAEKFSSLPGPARRHPQIFLHGIYWGTLTVVWISAPHAGIWRDVFVLVAYLFPSVIWRFGYVLLAGQYGRIAATRFSDHFLTLWPVYGGTNTPVNGFHYFSRFEAKNAEQLARSQLAGIKLLILAGLWKSVMMGMDVFVYGNETGSASFQPDLSLNIPKLRKLVAAGGTGSSPWLAWLSVYLELIYQVLKHAAAGHVVIGVVRIAGFNVFRNTYKPLLAESIVEFWNRYYFYFKELMANFFFLPTFSRLGSRLRNWPKLRLFLAVFSAAFVGNIYYHLIRANDAMVIADGAVIEAIFRSRTFYCFLLALGIFFSMLREQLRSGRPTAPGLYRRVGRIAGVWTFFALIYIWNVKHSGDFSTRVNFFLSLFGLL